MDNRHQQKFCCREPDVTNVDDWLQKWFHKFLLYWLSTTFGHSNNWSWIGFRSSNVVWTFSCQKPTNLCLVLLQRASSTGIGSHIFTCFFFIAASYSACASSNSACLASSWPWALARSALATTNLASWVIRLAYENKINKESHENNKLVMGSMTMSTPIRANMLPPLSKTP